MAGRAGTSRRARPDPIGQDPAMQSRLDSQEFFLQTDLLGDIRRVTELANRYNVAIYSVDPRGLAAFEFDLSTAGQANVSLTKDSAMLRTTMDSLRILADETDGRAILNSNDLAGGLRQIVRDASAYYLLGYTSTLNQPDGKFHKINVRVKRPGLQVRARPGYLALTATEAERALAPKKAGPPPAVDRSARDARRQHAATPQFDPHVDRHVARHEREDEDQFRLGADTRSLGRASRGAGEGVPDGRRGQFGFCTIGSAESPRAAWSSRSRPERSISTLRSKMRLGKCSIAKRERLSCQAWDWDFR